MPTVSKNPGVAYENGHGVNQDHAKAVRRFRMAAEQGDDVGQCRLGFMYDNALRVATATLGADAGGGAPFNILPLHIKNLIPPTMSWVNQWEYKAEEERSPNERSPVNRSSKS